MIPTRPNQDDLLFPRLDAVDSSEDVEWLNEFERDESWETLRTARRTLGLHLSAPPPRPRRPRSRSLSQESRRLLEAIAPDSPLVRQMLGRSDVDETPVETPESERRIERIGQSPAGSRKRKRLEKALQLLEQKRRRSARNQQATNPDSAPEDAQPKALKLSKADAKALLRTADKLKQLQKTPENPEPEPPESKSQLERQPQTKTEAADESKDPAIGRFGRVVPRYDVRGEKRRRRLKSVREEVRERFKESPQPECEFGTSSPFDINDAEFASATSDNLKVASSFSLPEDLGEDPSNVAGAYSVAMLRAEEAEPAEETYAEWFQRVIVRNRWMTWFTTFYIHWLLLLFLAGVIVTVPQDTADRILDAAFLSDPADIPPVDHAPLEIESPTFEEIEEVPLETQVQLSLNAVTEIPASMEEVTDIAMAVPKAKATETETRPLAPPPPMVETAVTAGSFSVWTEPTTPNAGEPYRIIIQVRLPEGVDRYHVSDLQGVVIGSDGYRKPIPGSASGELPVRDGYARFVVPIVSADEKVKDTVMIRSKLLKETQKLLLEF